MHLSNTLKAAVLLILLGFIWGSGYALAKFAMTNQVSPLGYAFWQSLGPAVLLTIAALFTSKSALFKPTYWPFYFISGLIGIAIPNTNMYFIAPHIPAGLLAVLVNTVPLLVYPLALLSRQERFDPWRVAAICMGMFGILLITGIHAGTGWSYWIALALLSPLSFALCAIYIAAKQPKDLDAVNAASGMLAAASCLLMPLLISQQAFYPLTGEFTLVKQVIVLEILLSTAGYLLFFYLIHLAGPVFYSLTGGIVAITGLFWGYLVFAEKPSVLQSIAILLIIFAIFLLSWRQRRQQAGA